jgi:DNA repair exonuclease SbcCD ATPase subunit
MDDAEKASNKRQSAEDEMNRRKIAIDRERLVLTQRAKALSNVVIPDLDDAMNLLQTKIKHLNTEISQLENDLYNFTAEVNEKIINLRSQLEKSKSQQTKIDGSLRDSIRYLDAKTGEVMSLESQLTSFKLELDLSDLNHTQSEVASTCRSCGQPITSKKTRDFLRQSLTEKIDVATSQLQAAKDELAAAETYRLRAQEDAKTIADTITSDRNLLEKEEASLSSRTTGLRHKLQDARFLQSTHSSEYSRLVRQSQAQSQSKVAQSNIQSDLKRLDDALTSAVGFYDICCSDLDAIEKNIADIKINKEALTKQASSYGSLIDVFGSKGIQTFIIRNLVNALEYYSQSYLDELSDGSLQLLLRVGSNDNIIKHARIQNPDGTWRERSLSSLSGGQWRRCSLSLSLGFMDLASHRGKLRSSLLVLDEPLTHLDSAGRSSVGKLLRKMLSERNEPGTAPRRLGGLSLSTILVILQDIAAEEIEECFDYIDEVIKSDGESSVHVAMNRQ